MVLAMHYCLLYSICFCSPLRSLYHLIIRTLFFSQFLFSFAFMRLTLQYILFRMLVIGGIHKKRHFLTCTVHTNVCFLHMFTLTHIPVGQCKYCTAHKHAYTVSIDSMLCACSNCLSFLCTLTLSLVSLLTRYSPAH